MAVRPLLRVIHHPLLMQVSGLLQLDAVLRKQPAAALLLFSSVSSIVAPLGQPNYAAANAILNSYANASSAQVCALYMPVKQG